MTSISIKGVANLKKINQFKTFVILTTIAAILGTITLTMVLDTNNIVVRVLNDGISTVQSAVIRVTHDIRNFGQSTFQLFETHDENQRLRGQMYSVELANIENALLQEELLMLREVLEIDETLIDFERIIAITIGRDINYWHDFLTIDQGSQHGVELGMAVVSPEGYLIGRITETGYISSRFHLMKPHNNDIRAHVEVLGVEESRGIFHGYDAETGELTVRQVPRDAEIEIGARVITSGLGGVFPRGLLAGYVASYELSTDGLTQTLFLTNNVEYDDLRFVFIIKRDMEEPDEPTPTDENETEAYDETAGDE